METLFSKFKDIKVAVVGDVMLDTYWWGNVERISPEAPVPVVSMNSKEYRIGGAGNVALNLAALGAQTSIFSVIGNDEDGNTLKQLLENNNINTKHIVSTEHRITTSKTRVICRNQQLMRIDNEITTDLEPAQEQSLINAIEHYIVNEKPQILIFEDYNKGILTEGLITKVIDFSISSAWVCTERISINKAITIKMLMTSVSMTLTLKSLYLNIAKNNDITISNVNIGPNHVY